jgi:hypothetical protein
LRSGQVLTYLATNTGGGFSSTTSVVKAASSIKAIGFKGWNVDEPASNSSANETCSGELSAGAKGGIGVGAALGAIGILSLIWAFFLVRRRPKTVGSPYSQEYAAVPSPPHEPLAAQLPSEHRYHEEPKRVHEISGYNTPAELSSSR